MIEPIIFYVAAPDILKYSVKFPNGKIFIFHKGDTYETCDAEEIDFLSKQKFIAARKLDDKEFRVWATLRYKDVPTVEKKITDKTEIEAFLWNSESEEYAVNKLKEHGYLVYKREKRK